MKIAVTGATGTLGKAVIFRLRELGHSVIGFGMNPEKIAGLKNQNFDIKRCDITNLPKLAAAVKDCDVIVHCAAYAAPFGRKERFFQTNVSGTKNVFYAGQENACSRIIMISSASIFDRMPHNSPHGDALPQRQYRPKHYYGASKYDAELFCLSQPNNNWIGLRPRAVFGPGDQTLIPRLTRLIGKNSYKTIGDGSGLIDVTCLSNFVDAVCLAIEAPEDKLGKFYNISNGDPRTFNSIMKAYTDKLPGVYQQRKLPYIPILLLSYLASFTASLIPGRPWEPNLTPYGVRQVTASLTLDISGAQEALNWHPKKSFEEGMEEL